MGQNPLCLMVPILRLPFVDIEDSSTTQSPIAWQMAVENGWHWLPCAAN